MLQAGASARPVSGFAAVHVYTHGLSKQAKWALNGNFIPIKASNFTQDDVAVYAYFQAALYSANITWQWYDPTGQLYSNRTTQAQCQASPCTFVQGLTLAGTGIYPAPAATKYGLWRLVVLANGYALYSDVFSVNPVITEEDSWNFNVTQSTPAVVHGRLTVTIHPNNQTWSTYRIYMPYGANFTSFDAASNRTLMVSSYNESMPGSVVVNFGGARADGYRFTLGFDLVYGLNGVNGYLGVGYSFRWVDEPYSRPVPDARPIPETFMINLPRGSTFVDLIGINSMNLNRILRGESQPSISFGVTLAPHQRFGWAILYRDYSWANSHVQPVTATMAGLNYAQKQPLPVFPITLGGMSLWSGVMSVLILIASEAVSPLYGRTGLLLNRKRLRIAALLLITVFIIATASQLIISQQPVPSAATTTGR